MARDLANKIGKAQQHKVFNYHDLRICNTNDEGQLGAFTLPSHWQDLTVVVNDVHDDDQPSEQGKKRKLRSSTLATGTAKRRRDATGERLSPKADSEYKKLPNA
jgi:hypothetical protein